MSLSKSFVTPNLSQVASDQKFEAELLGLIPNLRAFSISLCGRHLGEDMAQEALTRAWKARGSFRSGTKMKAWLFTILRNEYTSERRRAWRQVAWDQDAAERIAAPALEEWISELSDVRRAMLHLPAKQREALLLVTTGPLTYEVASRIAAAPIGTMKSRVTRGRARLLDILGRTNSASWGTPPP